MALNPTYQKQLEDYKKSEKERERIEREAIQKLINEKLATATSDINKQIAAVPGQYIDQERAVEARRIANERNLMEQMARAGAYGSGFSDTMQASINIAAGNQQAALDRQKQEAINRLNQTLLELQSALRQEEISRLADLSSRTSANIANKQSELFALQKQEEAAAAQAKAAQLQAAAQAKAAQLQAQTASQKQMDDRFYHYVDQYLENSDPNDVNRVRKAYNYAYSILGYYPQQVYAIAEAIKRGAVPSGTSQTSTPQSTQMQTMKPTISALQQALNFGKVTHDPKEELRATIYMELLDAGLPSQVAQAQAELAVYGTTTVPNNGLSGYSASERARFAQVANRVLAKYGIRK